MVQDYQADMETENILYQVIQKCIEVLILQRPLEHQFLLLEMELQKKQDGMDHMVNILESDIQELTKLRMLIYQDFTKMLGVGKEFHRVK